MRLRDYFIQSARCFLKSIVLLAQGVYYTFKRLFTRYPNPTWMVIVLCLFIYSVVKIADARRERDGYSHENALLIQQIDSLSGNVVRYSSFK